MNKLTQALTLFGLASTSVGICLVMIVDLWLLGGGLLGLGFGLTLASGLIHYYRGKEKKGS